MAQSDLEQFDLDVLASSTSEMVGVVQPIPCEIERLQVEEGDAVVYSQHSQPLPEPLQEQVEQATAPDTEDMLLDSVMGLAHDLPTFRELESYRFGPVFSDFDNDNQVESFWSAIEGDEHFEVSSPDRTSLQKSHDYLLPQHFSGLQASSPLPGFKSVKSIPPSHDGALKFTIAGLNKITDNFSERCKIGQGGSGTVYQGKLPDGTTVAIKRIKKDIFGIRDSKEFQTEAVMRSQVKHPNLVRLMGFVEDEEELILVTEFVSNGNLRQHLDGRPYGVILDMEMRFSIAEDVAVALQYLHYYLGSLDTIHKDIKSSNILITDYFHAKVAGFGIFRHSLSGDVGPSKQDKETSEDMDPKWLTKTYMEDKSLVYSFGKLLVEIFTGRYPEEPSGPIDACSIHKWVIEQLVERRLMDIIDPKILQTTAHLVALQEVFKLALSCLDPEEIHRPTIGKVLMTLSNIVIKCYLALQSNSKEVQGGPEGSDEEGFQQKLYYPLFPETLVEHTKDSIHTDYLNPSLQNIEYPLFPETLVEHTKDSIHTDYLNPSLQNIEYPLFPETLVEHTKDSIHTDYLDLLLQNIEYPLFPETLVEHTKDSIHTDYLNPSLQNIEPHVKLHDDGFESLEAQTSKQFEANCEQETRQVPEMLDVEHDQILLLNTNIIPDLVQSKSDETCMKLLQEEIAKLDYISKLICNNDDFHQNLANIDETSFFLHFDKKDDVFEFYFKNYEGMASIVGVGLEFAKVILEDGWKVIVKEISKQNYNGSWKKLISSSSTLKVTIPRPLDGLIDDMENSQKSLAFISRGQLLLLDLAQYFILKMAIDSFVPRDSMTHANTTTGSSSTSSRSTQESSSSDSGISKLVQTVKSIIFSKEAMNELRTKNGSGTPIDLPSNNDMKKSPVVHLRLLPGGHLFNGDQLFNATNSNAEELEEWTSQLNNTIHSEMKFTFVNEDERKDIEVIVGPISFEFQAKNEDNYQKNGRFGWFHKILDVSFGIIDASYAELGSNFKAHDIVEVKKTKIKGSTNATTHGTTRTMNGGVQGAIPHVLTLKGEGSYGSSTSKSIFDNVGETIEKVIEETRNGFTIIPKPNRISSTLKFTYTTPDSMMELDHTKLTYYDYYKDVYNSSPICIPQDVTFEGTWHPKKLENNAPYMMEYTLKASREVHMSSIRISKEPTKKSWMQKLRYSKKQEESNEPLKFTQKYVKSIFLNHAMIHMDGKTFKVKEQMNQRPLNQMEPPSSLVEQYTCSALQWSGNPLVDLNSHIDHQQ